MSTPGNLLQENYDGGYILTNGGWRTGKPVYVDSDLTVTGTTNIAGVSLTDLTTTGNTTLGNATSDTLTVNGNSTFTGTATGTMVDVVVTDTTTGIGVDLTGNTALTTGQLLSIASSATAIATTGRLFLSNHTGATGTSAVLNEFASAATDETVIVKVTASAALALGTAFSVASASTTGTAVAIASTAATTGGSLTVTDSSADTGTRSSVAISVSNAAASGATALTITSANGTKPLIAGTGTAATAHFFKVATVNGVTWWVGDGTTANAALSGTAGDVLFNGGSNKPEYCTGTTSWTALV